MTAASTPGRCRGRSGSAGSCKHRRDACRSWGDSHNRSRLHHCISSPLEGDSMRQGRTALALAAALTLTALEPSGLDAQATTPSAPPKPSAPSKPSASSAPSTSATPSPYEAVLQGLQFREIGPAVMGGRIDDFAVVESNPVDRLCRHRVRRRLEDDQRRHDLDADLRRRSGLHDRRRDARPFRSVDRLGRHRRAEQPSELVVGQRRLQVDRRRPDVASRRPPRNAPHRPHRHSPGEPRHRLRRRGRTPVGPEQGARRLQDERRRRDVAARARDQRRHRRHRSS